jgi:hypothetical protein
MPMYSRGVFRVAALASLAEPRSYAAMSLALLTGFLSGPLLQALLPTTKNP